MVVGAELEADLALVVDRIGGLDRVTLATHHLVGDRGVLHDVASAGADDQVALRIDVDVAGATEVQRDARRVAARRDEEIVLELPLVAVIDKVHARIQVVVADLAEVGDIAHGALAGEVVAARLLGRGARDARAGVGAVETEVDHGGCGAVVAAQAQHGLGLRQVEAVARPTREVTHGGVGLALVGFEGDRQFAVGLSRGSSRIRAGALSGDVRGYVHGDRRGKRRRRRDRSGEAEQEGRAVADGVVTTGEGRVVQLDP